MSKRKHATNKVSKKAKVLSIKEIIETELGFDKMKQIRGTKFSPKSIKIFAFCHGELLIESGEIPENLIPLPLQIEGVESVFVKTGVVSEITHKYSDEALTFEMSISHVQEEYYFSINAIYMGYLNFILHTPGSCAGLPTIIGDGGRELHEELIHKVLADEEDNFQTIGISELQNKTYLCEGPLSELGYCQTDSNETLEEVYDKNFLSTNGPVSLIVDKLYQTKSSEYIDGMNYGKMVMFVEHVIDGKSEYLKYDLLPFNQRDDIENAKTALKVPNYCVDQDNAVDEYFSKFYLLSNDTDSYACVKTSDVITLLQKLFYLKNTKIELYDSACLSVRDIPLINMTYVKEDYDELLKKREEELPFFTSVIMRLNSYLRKNDISFGKRKTRKSKVKRRKPKIKSKFRKCKRRIKVHQEIQQY